MHRFYFIFLILLFNSFAHAELPDYRLGLRTQVVSTNLELTPREPLSSDDKLIYTPAEANYVGIILGYKWAAGTVYWSVGQTAEKEQEQGKANYNDYGFTLYMKKFGVELNYNRFRGYYIKNSAKLDDATLNGESNYKLRNMSAAGYGGNFFYMPKPGDYSLAAAVDQSDVQSSSGGSFLVILSARHQEFNNDTSIIPASQQSNFGIDATLKNIETTYLGVGPGYAYNFVFWDGYFVSFLLGLTIGNQHVRWSLDDNTKHLKSNGTVNTNVRAALGYNINSFFLTLSAVQDTYNQNARSLEVSAANIITTLSIAKRF